MNFLKTIFLGASVTLVTALSAPAALALPSFQMISPSMGETGGGTRVTIYGQNLTEVTRVTVGSGPCRISSIQRTQLFCTTAPGNPGRADVRLVNRNNQIVVGYGAYTYVNGNPSGGVQFGSISPNVADTQGGAQITITGQGLDQVVRVLLGGTDCNINWSSNNQLTCTTMPASPGLVNLRMITRGGANVDAFGVFTYVNGGPGTGVQFDWLSPDHGSERGGTQVTVHGRSMDRVNRVLLGGSECMIQWSSMDQLTCRTSPQRPGLVNLRLITDSGFQVDAYGVYTYERDGGGGGGGGGGSPVSFQGLSPNMGSRQGGTQVSISGWNLDEVARVQLGGSDCWINWASNSGLSCTTSPNSPGIVNLRLTTRSGQQIDAYGVFQYY